MQKREKILDNVASFAGNTAGIVSGLHRNIREDVKSRIDEVIDRLDLVPREDLTRTQSLLDKALKDIEALKQRVDDLENTKKTKKKK